MLFFYIWILSSRYYLSSSNHSWIWHYRVCIAHPWWDLSTFWRFSFNLWDIQCIYIHVKIENPKDIFGISIIDQLIVLTAGFTLYKLSGPSSFRRKLIKIFLLSKKMRSVQASVELSGYVYSYSCSILSVVLQKMKMLWSNYLEMLVDP